MGLVDSLREMHGRLSGTCHSVRFEEIASSTMALIVLIAYKAWQASYPPGSSFSAPTAGQEPGLPVGDPYDVLGGLFGYPSLGSISSPTTVSWVQSALVGGNLGSIIAKGMERIVSDMERGGLLDPLHTSMGAEPNARISGDEIAGALGNDTIDILTQKTGLSRDQLLAELTARLPTTLQELSADGHLLTGEEVTRRIYKDVQLVSPASAVAGALEQARISSIEVRGGEHQTDRELPSSPALAGL
jgi:uncharacterized protein YidB (DUF937 family)